ncbi:hypothetical protein Bca4012_070037 [Brassica carinata]
MDSLGALCAFLMNTVHLPQLETLLVPKLIHPFCLQQFHPLKGHIQDAWMLVDITSLHQELNANRPATPTRGRPLQMTKEVLWLRCKVEEEALCNIPSCDM